MCALGLAITQEWRDTGIAAPGTRSGCTKNRAGAFLYSHLTLLRVLSCVIRLIFSSEITEISANVLVREKYLINSNGYLLAGPLLISLYRFPTIFTNLTLPFAEIMLRENVGSIRTLFMLLHTRILYAHITRRIMWVLLSLNAVPLFSLRFSYKDTLTACSYHAECHKC